MFTFITKTVSSFWNHFEFSNDKSKEEFGDYKVSDSDSDEDKPSEYSSSKEIHGVVTNVNASSRFGFVNGDVYFSYDVIADNRHPIVGDKVIAITKRSREGDPWKATLIILVDEYWDDVDTKEPQNERNIDSTTGLVVASNNDFIELDNGTKLCLKNIKCLEFVPLVGDVILFSLESSKIEPSRTREIHGDITSVRLDGTGIINREIWFNSAACLNGFRPRRGSQVVVFAIESRQQHFLWRAIKVVPKQLPRTVPNNTAWNCNKSPVQRNFLHSLLSDKEGITVTSELGFGVLIQGVKGYITVHIKNGSQNAHTLQVCRFQRKECQFTLGPIQTFENDCCDMKGNFIVLSPNAAVYINIFCNTAELGRCRELLLFDFEGFQIARHVTIHVKHPQEDFLPNSTNRRPLIWQQNCIRNNLQEQWIISGVKPFRTQHYLPVSLPMFAIPDKMRITVLEKGDIVSVSPALAQDLSIENYFHRFSALLHLEEIQIQLDMHQFDMFDVCLSQMGAEYLSLNVPGLAEGRPSLMMGDRVYLKSPDGINSPIYQGYIHEVLMEYVLIKFNASFHSMYTGESYDASFECSRTGMRRCHQATQQVKSLVPPEVLFPTNTEVMPPIYQTKEKTVWFNKRLNSRQKSAVQRILGHQCRPIPYIIFGPPGTGKTVTLVEAALQVFKCIKSSRLIICAPTNSAADLITLRLHESGIVNSNNLVRLNAYQRMKESIPEAIQQYCFFGNENLDKNYYHRILVSTCSNVGILYGLKINIGHFTHLFVDEAGQTTEPECLVAMQLVTSIGINGQIILAGDSKQLGPVLTSNYAKFYGLELSLFERLMSRRLYCRDIEKFSDHGNYDPLLVTKLIQNYRSHPAILKIYSELFYQSELQPSANNLTPVLWERLHNIDFPLLFHGIKGEELQEPDSPSFFNPSEVIQAVTYLQELYSLNLEPEDIGIITPYRKQVEKIKFMCVTLGLDPCKIGSVEEFQGQEKKVILLSTVRSIESDRQERRYNVIGFLGQPKRFNVAISRAKSLLVLIGDPDVLARDENWSSLLKYCKNNCAYVGCDTEEFNNCEDSH